MPEKLSSILFPTDFSTLSISALPWVMDMAAQYQAQIHCLYVVEEPQIYSSLDMGAVAIPTSGELVASAEARMSKFAEELFGDAPHGVSTQVVTGHAATEIVNQATATSAGMIVMTTHGYSGVKHMMLGSTTEDVLRNAPCPVLSVRDD